jgi:hypothetical protein
MCCESARSLHPRPGPLPEEEDPPGWLREVDGDRVGTRGPRAVEEARDERWEGADRPAIRSDYGRMMKHGGQFTPQRDRRPICQKIQPQRKPSVGGAGLEHDRATPSEIAA